jgi:thioredoxin reductase (NADPH)
MKAKISVQVGRIIETRHHQLFPVLDAAQIETAKRFASGPPREFAPGEIVYDVGERDAPAWLVLKGLINVVRRDGLNHEAALTSLGPGNSRARSANLPGPRRWLSPALAPKAVPRCHSTPPMCAP